MSMRNLVFLIFSLAICPVFGEVEWHTDYTSACQLAKKEDKALLLFFNGSDWSGWAMKMKHEVLDEAHFLERVGSTFICVEVDFPKHTLLPDETLHQNVLLKQRYHVSDIPSLIILDADQRVISQMNYMSESGEQLACDLLKLVDQDQKLVKALNSPPSDPRELNHLYQLAQELNRQTSIEKILELGLQTEDPFFFLEKYRLLVEEGKMKEKPTLVLRQKIFDLDPKNKQGVHFTVALIDFQELCQKQSPKVAAAPLVEYLENFGVQDVANTWRVEMMIAQLYLDTNVFSEALKHAQRAYDTAPAMMQQEIAHSVDYIRSQTEPAVTR